MNSTRTVRGIAVGLLLAGGTATQAALIADFAMNPTSAFVRQDAINPNTVTPLVIDLAAINVRPGDEITVTEYGGLFFAADRDATFPGSRANITGTHAVFSSSNTVLGEHLQFRVPGATGTAGTTFPTNLGFVLEPTFLTREPTDITQDFAPVRAGTALGNFYYGGAPVIVPEDARFLLVGVIDTYASDNLLDGEYGVRIYAGLDVTPYAFSTFTNATINDPALLANAAIAPDQGVSLVAGSAVFDGDRVQGSASFVDGLHLGDTLNINKGILLTSGDGTPPPTNTATDYSATASGHGIAALDAIVASAGQVTRDGTSLAFDFLLAPEFNGVAVDFAFATEEFPDQEVVDIGAIFVNGVNYAQFPGGQPLSFIAGSATAAQFFDNTGGVLNIEYDGITALLSLRAPAVSGGLNHILFAVADTDDDIFDSGLFISGLRGVLLGEVGGGESGSSPTSPLLPIPGDDPADGFDFALELGDTGLGISTPIFIDPVVALGYTFISSGPNFAEVVVPMALPGGDGDFLIDLGGGVVQPLRAGIPIDLLAFAPGGFSQFSILGIDPAEGLDASDPAAFVTGVKFVSGGSFSVRMIPITGTSVDSPAASGLIVLGMAALFLLRRGRGGRAFAGARAGA